MLEENILIQVDATVIAGILILLTIGSFDFKGIDNKKIQKIIEKLGVSAYSTVFIITLPFSLSAVSIVADDLAHLDSPYNLIKNIPFVVGGGFHITAEVLTGAGFIFVLWIVFKIAKAEDRINEGTNTNPNSSNSD